MTPRFSIRAGHIAAAILFAAAALVSVPALAEHVQISGTHSKQEIKAACDKVGGIDVEGDGGKGYGCFNYHKNTMVACDDEGKCDGFVPGKQR